MSSSRKLRRFAKRDERKEAKRVFVGLPLEQKLAVMKDAVGRYGKTVNGDGK